MNTFIKVKATMWMGRGCTRRDLSKTLRTTKVEVIHDLKQRQIIWTAKGGINVKVSITYWLKNLKTVYIFYYWLQLNLVGDVPHWKLVQKIYELPAVMNSVRVKVKMSYIESICWANSLKRQLNQREVSINWNVDPFERSLDADETTELCV